MLDMTAWKFYVIEWDHTLSTRLSARGFLACVTTRLMSALAWLLAQEDCMHRFRMASGPTLMTTIETIGACFSATPFRA
jgi:hypothetical protein